MEEGEGLGWRLPLSCVPSSLVRPHREQGLRGDRGLMGVVVTPRGWALDRICRGRAGVPRKKFLSLTNEIPKRLTCILAENGP